MIKTIALYLLIILFSVLCSLVTVEILLRKTNFLDQLNSPYPSYIPSYLFDMYKDVDKDGYVDEIGFRSANPDNNLLNSLIEYSGCKVVLLGDSFVWGSGVSIEDTWPSRLQRHTQCAVFPFGKPGWSSYQYMDFYEKHLKALEFDYLIIGVVANDLHPFGSLGSLKLQFEHYGRHETKLFNDQSKYFEPFLIDDYLDSIIGGYIDSSKESTGSIDDPPIISWGYENWRNRMYEPDVFDSWVANIVKTMSSLKHTACVLLTPTGNSRQEVVIFEQLANAFQENDIFYLNMMPELNAMFDNQLRPRSAWANPSDAHPGLAQNQLYAQGASKLLDTCKR